MLQFLLTQIGKIKSALSAINGTIAKQTGTITTNVYTPNTIDNVATLFKSNGIAQINLDVTGDNGTTFPTATNLFSVPSEFAPASDVKIPAILHHKTADVWVGYFVLLKSTGYIQQDWSSSCDGVLVSSSYII